MVKAITRFLTSAALVCAATSAHAWTIDAVKTEPAFDLQQKTLVPMQYKSLEPSEVTKKWKICVLLPHTDNPFMVSVLYGAVSEAKRLGLHMEAQSAGGYPNVSRQIDQVESCVSLGMNAIVLVSTSTSGLDAAIAGAASKGVVVIDTINGVTSDKIAGRVVTSYGKIGDTFGKYMAKKHPAGSGKTNVLYMAGPAGASYVGFMEKGFNEAIAGSDLQVEKSLYGGSSKAAQLPLVEDGLLAYPNTKYIAGNAGAIEAASDILREKGKSDIALVSGFVTPQVLEGVEQGRIQATVSASEVMQPSMAIDMAVRALEKKLVVKDVAPNSFIIDGDNVKTFDRSQTTPPNGWQPVFTVE